MVSQLLDEVRSARSLPSPQLARAIREAAGVSQMRLATELGVCRATVNRWELGLRRPRGELLVKYVGLLNELKVAA